MTGTRIATTLLVLSAFVATVADAAAPTGQDVAPLTRRALLSPGESVAQAINGRLVTASFASEGGRCVVALSREDVARTVLEPAYAVRLEDPAGGLLSMICGHGGARMLVERRDAGGRPAMVTASR